MLVHSCYGQTDRYHGRDWSSITWHAELAATEAHQAVIGVSRIGSEAGAREDSKVRAAMTAGVGPGPVTSSDTATHYLPWLQHAALHLQAAISERS